MQNSWIDEFPNPSAAYRGAPFWSWNAELVPSELQRQVRVMYQMGLGGFFMHSRVGLATHYMSEEWMQAIRACTDEAARHRMRAWLYDEDRWPSGFAGGFVTQNPQYRQRQLKMSVCDEVGDLSESEAEQILAVFRGAVADKELRDLAEISPDSAANVQLKNGEKLFVFEVCVAPSSPRFNDETYLDTLNHEAVREFIRVTHEAYAQYESHYFGNVIPGIFTDEPQHVPKMQKRENPDGSVAYLLPWTPDFPEIFRDRFGYELLPHLPALYYDVAEKESLQPRRDYHECVAFLFADAYARQIGEWCGKYGIEHTGHVMEEPPLSRQNKAVTNCLRFYEYMQAPGMDLLTQYNREYDTAKQVTSVARQFNRKWRLSETYGCTGWDFPFEGHKAIGDWQVALGINLRCPHLSWYTMEGEAKRDFPASIFFQSPWWPYYSKVEDYFARINTVMTQGEETRHVLVVHPIESMWTLTRVDYSQEKRVKAYDAMLRDLRDTLLAANIDFDYGDEDIMARHADVEDAGGEETLRVGEARYKAVVIPPVYTLRSSTLKLLEKFMAKGGKVVVCSTPPEYVDAAASEDAQNLLRECPQIEHNSEALISALGATCRPVSIVDGQGEEIVPVLSLLREDKSAYYLFLCNVGHDFRGKDKDPHISERDMTFSDVRIRGFQQARGTPLELNPETGCVDAPILASLDAGLEIQTSLTKLGSRLFVIPKTESFSLNLPRDNPKPESVEKLSLPDTPWHYQLSEENVFVLDQPAYSIGENAPRSGPEEILKIDRKVRDYLGIQYRGGGMVQPWARETKADLPEVPVNLNYSFEIEELPQGPLFLALERPDVFDILVNNTPVNPDNDCGWWVDPSLRCVPVDPALLREGTNELALRLRYNETYPGLEIVYLLGHFGVSLQNETHKITELPSSLHFGDWGEQGLPFYSGNLTYMTTFSPQLEAGQRLFVHIPSYRGVAVRVLIDGEPVDVCGWEPRCVEITPFVRSGCTHRLGLQVLGHRRNSHGPLHLNEERHVFTGPGSFLASEEKWTYGYMRVPCGLMEAPFLEVCQD